MAKKILNTLIYYVYIFVLHFCYKEVLGNNNNVRVTVEQGVLQGEEKVPVTGIGKYFSFKGIPFAKPPLGDLRFQAPQPPSNWEGVRDAINFGFQCVQIPDNGVITIGNEDCLYLNVYTPNMNPLKPLSVMFWIHGGRFVTGSGNDDMYGPDFLIDHDIVLVTSNYRLGALGFLSADTKNEPGNAGLKDQIAALQWVKNNIKHFGGDPKQVTIFGQAAGGSCVTYHMVSPLAKGLFNRAIAMGGTLFSEFGSTFGHRLRAYNLAKKLGIYTKDQKELISSLKEIPAEKLVAPQSANIFLSEETYSTLNPNFGPIIEKDQGGYHYLTEQPIEIKKKGQLNVVDLLRGHTVAEGLISLIDRQDFYLKYIEKYLELFVPQNILRLKSPVETLKIGETIKNYYFGDGTFVLSNATTLVDFISLNIFVYPIHYFSDFFLPRNYRTNNFFYEFDIYTTRNVFSKPGGMRYGIYKATHKDELPYLFHGSGYNIPFDINDESYKYIKLFCTLITNFAKYGNPTPKNAACLLPKEYQNFPWPEYYKNMNALIISKKPYLSKIQYDSGVLKFWKSVYDKAGVTPYVGDPE